MRRRHYLRIAVIAAALLAVAPVAYGQSNEFRWHGVIAPGSAIEIKGVNGGIRAEAAAGNEVEVVADKRARRDNPEDARIDVVPHGDGVTICAVYPSRDASRPNECLPGKEGRMNVQNNDVTVNFTVRVPSGTSTRAPRAGGVSPAVR